MRRRRDFEIIVDILKEALEGAPKTRIMQRAALGYESSKNYLVEVTSRNLIKVEENGRRIKIYRTTQKGRELLSLLEKATGIWSADSKQTT
jgi:predicted transcriptional regulator